MTLNAISTKSSTMSLALGPLEVRLFEFLQRRSPKSIGSGDLERCLGWSREQERSVLSRLARKGMIVRVRPGLYLAPPGLPPGGAWSPGEFLALTTLMADRGARYQISGPYAFHRHGWSEQVPNRVHVYNDRISGNRRIGPHAFTFIKVAEERLGDVEKVEAPGGIEVVHATRARALLDAVEDWSRFHTLPAAYDWISREVQNDDGFAARLIAAAMRHANQGTRRRIGAVLEKQSVAEGLTRRLERTLHPTSSSIPWDPSRPKRGELSPRWKVVFNHGE